MKEYIIKKTQSVPQWHTVPALDISWHYKTDPCGISAQAQVCYDDSALYVRLSAVEKYIRAEHMGPLGEICEDSCLEFFFSPIAGDQRYFNIESNPNGALYLGFASNVHNLQRLIPEEPVIIPKPIRTENGWEVTYQVPYAFIRQFFPDFAPVSGYAMRGNFFKCAELSKQPHFLCWCPVPSPPCAFHTPEYFGTLIFE